MFDMSSTFEVPRLHRPGRREFEERFLVPHRPVVITGLMEDWPTLTTWTNEYLKEKAGHRTIPISRAHAGVHLYDPKTRVFDRTPMRFADFLDRVTSNTGGELYAAACTIRPKLPDLWPDVRFPPFIDPKRYQQVNLWLGPGDNYSPLHYDASENFLTQVRGRKQVLLCPPDQIAKLYPFPFDYECHYVSQVDVTAPDLARFPAYERVERSLLELAPGEMLFIPFFWWHAMWGIEENMSVNYWWYPSHAQRLRHPFHVARGLAGKVVRMAEGAAGRVARKVAKRVGRRPST